MPEAEPPTRQHRRRDASDSATIRVVIADDHAVVRRGLRLLLDAEDGFEVVAEAADLDGARRYVRGHRPDVLVLDLNMPGGSSLDGDPRDPRRCPGHADRRADDAGRAGLRARGARRRRARLRAEGGRRGRAGRGGAPRRRGRHLPEPAARARASPPSRRPARPTASPSARSRCCG